MFDLPVATSMGRRFTMVIGAAAAWMGMEIMEVARKCDTKK
jgi:hypothetical protein